MDAAGLRDAIISAANNIINKKKIVDDLNVFPVPDGDTGTNMSMTMSAASRAMQNFSGTDIGEVAGTASSALLRGARGNSGVILSLLFRGFAKALHGKKTANAEDIAKAFASGVDAAYKAVMKPTEGTILTVARLSSHTAAECAKRGADVITLFEETIKSAKDVLLTTPELLPVLKKAGVVDAGGQGLVYIYEGMLSSMKGNPVTIKEQENETDKNVFTEQAGESITYTYCTEFIINRENDHPTSHMREFLDDMGDSIVVVDDDGIIKVHIHTDNPGRVLQEALKLGSLNPIKIENMREQYSAKKSAAPVKSSETFTHVTVDPSIPFGFVAVAAGDGVARLFGDLGVNKIVSGGQSMNPSTEDILSAIQAVPAQTVFVLPNNKNIIMAAEQAIPLADRRVCVVPTKTIPQGLTSMLSFDPSATLEENLLAMTKGAESVQTGQITYAARDSEFDGHKIKRGEVLALENGRLSFTERDMHKAAQKLARSMISRDSSFMTVIYGQDVTAEQAGEMVELIRQKLHSDIEISLIDGGQPIYYYIISVE